MKLKIGAKLFKLSKSFYTLQSAHLSFKDIFCIFIHHGRLSVFGECETAVVHERTYVISASETVYLVRPELDKVVMKT